MFSYQSSNLSVFLDFFCKKLSGAAVNKVYFFVSSLQGTCQPGEAQKAVSPGTDSVAPFPRLGPRPRN